MTDGCETDLAEMDEGVVTCNCNHLTNFAILVVSIPSVYVCVSVCVCVCVCVCADPVNQCYPKMHIPLPLVLIPLYVYP